MAAAAAPTQQEVDALPLQNLPEDSERLEIFLSAIDIYKARSSSSEYYRNNKDLSYPVNLQCNTRGRAVVFVMTRNRTGWQCDVWNLNKMFKSLNIQTKNVYDPTVDKIEDELKQFVTDDANNDSSCSFVVFMGHGVSKHGYDVCLQAADDVFDVMNYCEVIFGRPSSKLKLKPKMFLVQACRNSSPSADVRRIVSLRNSSILTDYLFVNACHPGQSADRESIGSSFVKYMTESIITQAHHKHIEDINKQVMRNFNLRRDEQMPQYIGSLPYNMNLFPGVTESTEDTNTDLDLISKMSIQETIDQGQDQVQISNPDTENPTTSDLPMRNSESSLLPVVVPSADTENRYDIVMEIDTIIPNTNEAREKALSNMKARLFNPEIRAELENCLSNVLETRVRVTDIKDGSIIIQINLENDTAAMFLIPLIDSGMLKRRLEKLLITQEYLDACSVRLVTINVQLDLESSEKIQPVVKIQVRLYNFGIPENLMISSPYPDGSGNVMWYKDEMEIKSSSGRFFEIKDGFCSMQIHNVLKTDRGAYICKFTDKHGREHIKKFYIEVLEDPVKRYILLENVRMRKIQTDEATVEWEVQKNIDSEKKYQVEYFLEQSPNEITTRIVDDSSCTLTDLIPGQSYKVYVHGVFLDDIESCFTPVNSLQFYTNINLKMSYDTDAKQIEVGFPDSPVAWGEKVELIGFKQIPEKTHVVSPCKVYKKEKIVMFSQSELLPGYSYAIDQVHAGPRVRQNVVIRQSPDRLYFSKSDWWGNSTLLYSWKDSSTLLLQTGYKLQFKTNDEIQEHTIQIETLNNKNEFPVNESELNLLPGTDYQLGVAVLALEGEAWFDPVIWTTKPDVPHIESAKIEESDGNYVVSAAYRCQRGSVDKFVVKTSFLPVARFKKFETVDMKTEISISKDELRKLSMDGPVLLILEVTAIYKGKFGGTAEHKLCYLKHGKIMLDLPE